MELFAVGEELEGLVDRWRWSQSSSRGLRRGGGAIDDVGGSDVAMENIEVNAVGELVDADGSHAGDLSVNDVEVSRSSTSRVPVAVSGALVSFLLTTSPVMVGASLVPPIY